MSLKQDWIIGTRLIFCHARAQEVLIGQLQRQLTELSRNSSPSVGPTEPAKDGVGMDVLDTEALRLGLTASRVNDGPDNPVTIDGGVGAAVAGLVP